MRALLILLCVGVTLSVPSLLVAQELTYAESKAIDSKWKARAKELSDDYKLQLRRLQESFKSEIDSLTKEMADEIASEKKQAMNEEHLELAVELRDLAKRFESYEGTIQFDMIVSGNEREILRPAIGNWQSTKSSGRLHTYRITANGITCSSNGRFRDVPFGFHDGRLTLNKSELLLPISKDRILVVDEFGVQDLRRTKKRR